MKVCILTEGGRHAGFGHAARCAALAHDIIKKSKERIETVFVVHGDSSVKKFLKSQHIAPKMTDWLNRKGALKHLLREADIIIVDSYLAPASFYKSLAVSAPNAYKVAIDDYARIDYKVDMVINPSIYAERLSYGTSARRYLLGERYIILRKALQDVPKKRVQGHIKDVLITFGGKDHEGFIRNLLKRLSQQFSDFSYHVLARSYKDDVSISDLMLSNDLCISAGGQTLYELARCGVATVGVCFANNQMRNLRGLAEAGFLKYAGKYDSKKIFNSIIGEMKRFLSQRSRKIACDAGREAVDGKGTKRIVAAIFENLPSAMKLRPVTRKDCYDIWRWRDDPKVRAVSFNKGKIRYDEHLLWFKAMMRNKSVKIYIAEDKNSRKIGQARFNFDSIKRVASININLNPKFFGHHLGGRLIKLATEKYVSQNPKVDMIRASILYENTASQGAFEKAGYIFSNNAYVHKRKTAIFTFKVKRHNARI